MDSASTHADQIERKDAPLLRLWMTQGTDGKRDAHLLLLRVLERVYQLPSPSFYRLPGGKPALTDLPLYFNLSHSGPFALLGVSDAPLGVDVERVKPRRAGLPRYALSDREFDWFTQRGSRWEDFYTLWTLKESRVKYTGQGLDRAPRTIAVPLLSAGTCGELDGLCFASWNGSGWCAAFCGEEWPQSLPVESRCFLHAEDCLV